jgi:hypothetical protein
MELPELIRRSLILFFLGFPLVMISFLGFVSLALGSKGTAFFLVGQAVIVPVATFLVHILTNFLPGTKVPASDVNRLVPSFPTSSPFQNVAPSYWMAHVSFFFAYILTNALEVHGLDPVSRETDYKMRVENRKTRTSMIIATTVVVYLAMIAIRFRFVKADKPFWGLILGTAGFGALGYGWFQLAKRLGIRNGDIFGVVQQMVRYDPNPTTICTPSS